MNNLPIEKIAKAYYGDVPLTHRRIELIRSSMMQDRQWIFTNFSDLGLDDDRDIQKDLIENYLRDSRSARLVMMYFDKFLALQEDFEIQKRILRQASEDSYGYLHSTDVKLILKNLEKFPVLKEDSEIFESYIERLVYLYSEDVISNLDFLEPFKANVSSNIEAILIESIRNRNIERLIKNIHRFETIKDDSDFQLKLLEEHLSDMGSRHVIPLLRYCEALLKDKENLKKICIALFRASYERTMDSFSEFTALYNGDADTQADLISKLCEADEYGIHYIISNSNQFKALQDHEGQARVVKIIMRFRVGRNYILRYFYHLNHLQNDQDIQNEMVEMFIENNDHFYLMRDFNKLKSLSGRSDIQESIFFRCASHVSVNRAISVLDKFDALTDRKNWRYRLWVSWFAKTGDPHHEWTESEREAQLLDGLKEASSEGNWESLISIVKHPGVRGILQDSWKKRIFEYIAKRESSGYNISERSSWKGIGLRSVEEQENEIEREKFNLNSLKKVLGVQRITPTYLIKQMLDRYKGDAESFDFVISLLHNGQTCSENVLEVLSNMDEFGKSISEDAQAIIQRMANSKFKGFSSKTFRHISNLETDKERDEQLIDWFKKSREILSCGVVSDEIRNSEFYHEIVFAAYRPVEYSINDVRNLLGTQFTKEHEKTWMSHVSRWKTKNWKAMRSVGYRLRNGKVFEDTLSEKVISWILSLKGMKPDSSEFDFERFWKILFATAKGRSFNPKDGDMEYLVEYFLRQEDDNSIKDSVIKLFEKYPIANNIYNVAFVYDFGSLIEDILQNLLSELVSQEFERMSNDSSLHQSENVESWIQKIVAKLERGSAQQIKRLKNNHSEKTEVWIQAKILSDMIGKSSELKKEVKFFSKQKKVIEPINGGYPYPIRVIITKSLESILSRASAGLCTSSDFVKFAKSDFLQMVVIDDNLGLIVGNIQLHLFDNMTKVLGRFNPSSKFLQTSVDHKILAAELVRIFHDFADLNGLEAYIPEQTGWHQLTNRSGTEFSTDLEKYFGAHIQREVQLNTNGQKTQIIYKCKRTLD